MVDIFSFFLGSSLTLLTYKLGRVFYRSLPYFVANSTLKPQKQNEIIIVAGGTDGIGKQYVRHFYNSNFNVMVIGRSQQKVNNTIKQISSNKSNVVIPLIIDFSQPLSSSIEKITSKIIELSGQMKIKGVVNSCGVACFDKYQDLIHNQIQNLHKVNLNSLNVLMKIFLQNDSKTQNSFFINISSVSARHPLKYSSIYSSTKAYQSHLLNSLSKQINSQLKILTIQPFYVKTKLIKYQEEWDTAKPQQIVNGSIKLLKYGRQKGMGCLKHELIDEFYGLLERIFQNRIQRLYQMKLKIKKLKKRKQ